MKSNTIGIKIFSKCSDNHLKNIWKYGDHDINFNHAEFDVIVVLKCILEYCYSYIEFDVINAF